MRIKMISIILLSICASIAFGNPPLLVVENGPEPGHGLVVGKEYTLYCSGTMASSDCTIQWFENDETLRSDNARIVVLVKPGSSTYMCSFVCDNQVELSNPKILTGQNLIRAEILNSGASGLHWTPLENCMLDLKCAYDLLSLQFTLTIEEDINPEFEWYIDDVREATSQDITQFAVPGYNKTIKCVVKHENEILESAVVRVEAVGEVDLPTVAFTEYDSEKTSFPYRTGASYNGHCMSKSHCSETNYLWTKDFFTIPITNPQRKLDLLDADAFEDDGVYRCRMEIRGSEYCSVTSVLMEVVDAGRSCSSDVECDGEEYSSSCRSNRCECAAGYIPIKDVCRAGVSTLIASTILLLTAFVLSRVF